MPTHELAPEILIAAIEGFEQQKLRIDAQIAELRTMLPGGPKEPAAAPQVQKGKGRKMSAAARKRIGDAQRKRWAESQKTSEPSQPAATSGAPKRKRKLSAAGRRAIAEATKKRWAVFHAAKEAAKPVVAKKGTAKKVAAKAPVKVAANKTVMKKSPKKVSSAAVPAPKPER
jgi:hypothetical protein